jgi:spherulation-specific family 4 protein
MKLLGRETQGKSPGRIVTYLIIAALILVLVPQSMPPAANAASGVTLSAVNSTSGTVSSSPYQIALTSFNVGTSANRLLVVGVSANNQQVSSVTFGGASLTKAVGSFFNRDAELWYLVNPSGTANILATMAGSTAAVVGAYAFAGVDQATPIPTTSMNHNVLASSPSVLILNQNPNSWVLDLPSIYGGVTLGSPSCTQQWDINVPNAITGASSSTVAASPGTFTCGWTASNGGNLWDDVAIEVKQSAPAITGIMVPLYCQAYTSDGSTACPSGVSVSNEQTTSATASSITLSNFAAGSASNRMLVVGVSAHSQSVSSVTFGGASLSFVVRTFPNNDAEFWYLTNPSSTPANIVVTMAGSTSAVVTAYALSAVDLTNPFPTPGAAESSTSSNSPLISITTGYAQSSVLSLVAISGGVTLSSPTCTQFSNVQVASAITGASSANNKTLAGSLTCGWTASSSAAWVTLAIEVKTSAGSFTWQPIADAKTNYPSVPIDAIINPDNGFPSSDFGMPGVCSSVPYVASYSSGTAALGNSGVVVLGYVDTSYTAKSIPTVESEIDNYKSCIPSVTGIFFDNMDNSGTSASINYYSTLTQYAKQNRGMTYTVANPGTSMPSGYLPTADNFVIFEDSSMPSSSTLSTNTFNGQYGTAEFSFISFNVNSMPIPTTVTSDAGQVSFLYVTNNTGCNNGPPTCLNPNPYNTITPYMGVMAADLNG